MGQKINGIDIDRLADVLKERIRMAEQYDFVDKPISHTLYHLWVEYARKEKNRNDEKNKRREG